jgi:hypothetical protein
MLYPFDRRIRCVVQGDSAQCYKGATVETIGFRTVGFAGDSYLMVTEIQGTKRKGTYWVRMNDLAPLSGHWGAAECR